MIHTLWGCVLVSETLSILFLAVLFSQIQVYSSRSNDVLRRVSHFKESAYGGRFRHDGKLLVAGGQEGIVKVRR